MSSKNTDIKFQTDKQNAPSWTVKMEFMEGVSLERNHSFLGVYPKLAVQNDNHSVISFNCFGLRYKHMDKFSISISNGSAEIEKFKLPVGMSFGSEKFLQFNLYPTSNTGSITVTDTFKSYVLTWEEKDDHVSLKCKDFQVAINYVHGVIDIPNITENQMMLNFFLQCKEKSNDAENDKFLEKMIDKYYKNTNLQ
jgi:hypothetical protein